MNNYEYNIYIYTCICVYTVYVYDSDIRIGPLICILWGPLTIVGEILGPGPVPFHRFLDVVSRCVEKQTLWNQD